MALSLPPRGSPPVWLLIGLVMTVGHCLAIRLLDRPAFPIYAIGSGSQSAEPQPPPPSQQDLTVIAQNFHYIQGRYNATELKLMHKVNADFRPVQYFMTHTSGAPLVEPFPGGRLAVLCYRAGYLVKNLGVDDTTLEVMVDESQSLLRPSTTSGSYSNATAYVTFLRLGNELVKIVNVTTGKSYVESEGNGDGDEPVTHKHQTVRVERAFDGSKAAAHSANSSVLAPLYGERPISPHKELASSSHSWYWPYNDIIDSQSRITYVVNPAADYSQEMLSNATVEAIQSSYAGSWYDCFSDGELRPLDMGGKGVVGFKYWNDRTDSVYTREEFDLAQRSRLARTWSVVHDRLHQYPTILANNVVTFYFQGGRNWLVANQTMDYRPLDGFCLEDFVGTLQPAAGGFSCVAPSWHWQFASHHQWAAHVQIVMNASQSNLAVLPMMANAGCKSFPVERLGQRRIDFEHYAYASFLLAVEKPDGATMLGIPAYYQDNGKRYAHVDDWLKLDIGLPTETHETVDDYLVTGHRSYRRHFTKGVVVVNPTNTTDNDVPLGGTYFSPDAADSTTNINAASNNGYVYYSK